MAKQKRQAIHTLETARTVLKEFRDACDALEKTVALMQSSGLSEVLVIAGQVEMTRAIKSVHAFAGHLANALRAGREENGHFGRLVPTEDRKKPRATTHKRKA